MCAFEVLQLRTHRCGLHLSEAWLHASVCFNQATACTICEQSSSLHNSNPCLAPSYSPSGLCCMGAACLNCPSCHLLHLGCGVACPRHVLDNAAADCSAYSVCTILYQTPTSGVLRLPYDTMT